MRRSPFVLGLVLIALMTAVIGLSGPVCPVSASANTELATASGSPLAVTKNPNPPNIGITPRQAGSAVVTVTTAGKPLADATVSVLSGNQTVTATTDAQGRATFAGLLPGEYTFTASRKGYISNKGTVSVSAGAAATTTISMTPITYQILVSVGDASKGGFLAGAMITVSGNGRTQTQTTDANGGKVFRVASGDYNITASKDGYGSKTVPVSVTKDDMMIISLTKQAGSAAIAVRNPNGTWLAGATVSVTVNGQVLQKLATNDCIAVFNDLPVGEYTFTASETGYYDANVKATVSVGTTAQATAVMNRITGNANIVVTDTAGGAPVPGATVNILYYSGQPLKIDDVLVAPVTTNPQGVAAFTGLPVGATYLFVITKAGYVKGNTSAQIADISTKNVPVQLQKNGSIAVTVVDLANNPVSGVDIVMRRADGTELPYKVTDSQGTALFTDLTNARYIVNPIKSGYMTYSYYYSPTPASNTSEVVAVNGETRQLKLVMLPTTGSVTVTVINSFTRQPISGATVMILGQTQTHTTDAQGMVTISGLASKNHTVQGYAPGYYSGSAGIDIMGNAATVTLPLGY